MIWLVGAGLMAKEYIKVLQKLSVDFLVIGRSQENCDKLKAEFNCQVVSGGLEKFLDTKPALPAKAIVSVGIEALQSTTILLLEYGVTDILLEKPGVGYPSEITRLVQLAKEKQAHVLLAYNRRFYASVLKAKELIAADGGATSCFFEFTEWSHVVGALQKHPAEHQNWFLGNSSHVIDTAFYLCGKPAQLCAFNAGGLDWHTAASVFSGAGITDAGVLFSYIANWEAPGRWGLEVMTKKHRYIFRPMEKLQLMKIGSVAIDFVEQVDYKLDEAFKPGLYLQTKAFLENDYAEFCDISAQEKMVRDTYVKMSNYLMQ